VLDDNRASVLAITSELPWPLDSGGHLRTYHLLRVLARRCDVRLLVPASGVHDAAGLQALRNAGVEVIPVRVRRRTAMRTALQVTRAALTRVPHVMFSRHHHHTVRRALVEQLAQALPDAMYCDHLDSFSYAAVAEAIPHVVDMHNVYSRLASRAALEQKDMARRLYLRHEAALLARMERQAAVTAHTVLAVSEEEADHFASLGARRVTLVPNGVECARYEGLPLARGSTPPTILYVGSFSWEPNVAAAGFLVRDVLPRVAQRVPSVRVVFVGKDPGPEMHALAATDARVIVAGNVPDVSVYLRDAHVLAVPLQVGGGTRLKILEAFAAGIPVVSTPVGCEGIRAEDGKHLVIVDRAGFANAITGLLGDRAQAHRLASAARALARERYDWEIVGAAAAEAVAVAARGARARAAAIPQLAARASMSR
jgi:glycosyltransferase involved in cell wall biosynthesis